MSKIIATYNSCLSSIQPTPLCPTWKCQSASHSGVGLFVIPWIVAQPGSSVQGILQTRILKWVALSFPRGSSPPRAWTWVSHIAGRLFNNWATREACPTSGASQFSCTLQEWGAGFPANPIRPPISQGAPLLCVGSHDWGTQYVAWTLHSPGQISTCVNSLFFWLFPEAQIPAWSPLFPSFTILVNLYYSICCIEIFLPASS